MKTPTIALVGRPNVGKSTLFNVLTRTRDALVLNLPGVTRDRQYGKALFNDININIIDTGGLSTDLDQDLAKKSKQENFKNSFIDQSSELNIDTLMLKQTQLAITESDLIYFIIDGRAGINSQDQQLMRDLRKQNKEILFIANKTDGIDTDNIESELHELGMGHPIFISATHRRGIQSLIDVTLENLENKLNYNFENNLENNLSDDLDGDIDGDGDKDIDGDSDKDKNKDENINKTPKALKIAFVGRPNVGKSTLTNRILGDDRVVVYDQPGTTRGSTYLDFTRRDKNYILIDTAGIRRKGKIKQTLEKFSIIKTLDSINDSNVTVNLIDGQEGITDQDLHLIEYTLNAGKALVIAINKWDGLSDYQRQTIDKQIERKLGFVLDFIKIHHISALHGTGVGDLFKSIHEAYNASIKKIPTSRVNDILKSSQIAHPPPAVRGRIIKLKYAHIGGHNPPQIIIHGNQTKSLPESYKRYLSNCFRKAFNIFGTPIKLQFESSENPYAGIRNTLTPRQQIKKQRLMKHVKQIKKSKKKN